jgi:hypothetical protein
MDPDGEGGAGGGVADGDHKVITTERTEEFWLKIFANRTWRSALSGAAEHCEDFGRSRGVPESFVEGGFSAETPLSSVGAPG